MARTIFDQLQKEVTKEIERTISSTVSSLEQELLTTFKREVDDFITMTLRNSILPELSSELYIAEHKMDIRDPFVQKKILVLNETIKKLRSITVTNSWMFNIVEETIIEIKFNEELNLILNKIDNGTKFIPRIKVFEPFNKFVNSLLGIEAT